MTVAANLRCADEHSCCCKESNGVEPSQAAEDVGLGYVVGELERFLQQHVYCTEVALVREIRILQRLSNKEALPCVNIACCLCAPDNEIQTPHSGSGVNRADATDIAPSPPRLRRRHISFRTSPSLVWTLAVKGTSEPKLSSGLNAPAPNQSGPSSLR